jgi:hypothetical protein
MTGAEIVGALLREDVAFVAVVPIARIKGGRLPDNIALPALLVRTTSSVERQPLRKGGKTRTVDRVSVAVRAASYADQVRIIKLVRNTLRGWIGDMPGANRVSILTAGTGPDLLGPADSFEQTADFRVSYDATT